MERKELEQMSVKELQAKGKKRGLGFRSQTKKADLIDRIRDQVKDDQKEAEEAKDWKKATKAEIRARTIALTEPWDGPESKSPAAFIRAGSPLRSRPVRNLEGSDNPLARLSGIGRIWLHRNLSPEADCIGAFEREGEADQEG